MPSQTSLAAVKNVVRYIAAYYSQIDMDSIKDDWFLGKQGRDKNNNQHSGVGLDQFAIDHSVTPELNHYVNRKGGTNFLLPGTLTEKTTIEEAAKDVRSRLP